MRISVDFETRSVVDLPASGVYPYASHPHTGIWCMAWQAEDMGQPAIWREGEPFPERLRELLAGGARLVAWNAQFERLIWDRVAVRRYGFPEVPLEQWECTLARSAAYGFCTHLGVAARVFGVREQKDSAGANLMRKMCRPRAEGPDGPVWWDEPFLRDRLAEYCAQDVRTERAIAEVVPPLQEQEQRLYHFDQRINDRGLGVDWWLVKGLLELARRAQEDANEQVRRLTGGAVNSITQVALLTEWLQSRGVPLESLVAAELDRALHLDWPDDVYEVMRLRREAARSSVAKLEAMLAYRDPADDRMHGLLQFHGAQTGRWAGRGPQPQNLPRVTTPNFESYVGLLDWLLHPPPAGERVRHWLQTPDRRPNIEEAWAKLRLWGNPLGIISQMLRRCITARDGCVFYGGDFASVEARMTAFLAGHSELVEAFRAGKDVYVEMAAKIYGVPPERVTKGMRQVGKIAILGLGYGMGAAKFRSTAVGYGIEVSEDEARRVVDIYRSVHEPIPRLWKQLQSAALAAVLGRENPCMIRCGGLPVAFFCDGSWLHLQLPSGRWLHYLNPRLEENEFGGRDLIVDAYSSMEKRVVPVKLYGGLLTENVVQAVCRDLLVHSMRSVEAAGFPVVLTVHDEILTEAPAGRDGLEEFRRAMATVPEWAAGFPLGVDVWTGRRYEK